MRTFLKARIGGALLIAALIAPALSGYAAPVSASAEITAISLTTLSGKTGRQPVSNLSVRDQSGQQDASSAYVSFLTPAVAYRGYFDFKVPGGVALSSLSELRVKLNYKGPKKSVQAWTWFLYNWSNANWVSVGDNDSTTATDTWKILSFTVSNPGRFIKPGSREIRLQMRSNNDKGDAKLDYAAIVLTYGTPATSTPARTSTGIRTATPGTGTTPARTASPTRTVTPAPSLTRTAAPSSAPRLAGCPMFPSDSIWNRAIDSLPVNVRSSDWIASIGRGDGLHMDFGSGNWDGGPIGIPYNVVAGSQARMSVTFYYPDESDPGPYPIPASPLIEWGGDRHILIVDKDNCVLYEIYDASQSNGRWSAGSGAIWNLGSNALRPAGWTSADAAGLPILPGLVRYDEILAGQINHAIRFTAPQTQSAYLWPARHLASDDGSAALPPMGARFRLKASFNISGYPAQMQVLLRAMKKYGILLADNGSEWYISGAPDARWNNDVLHLLDDITGNDFEAVDESGLMINSNSGAAKP